MSTKEKLSVKEMCEVMSEIGRVEVTYDNKLKCFICRIFRGGYLLQSKDGIKLSIIRKTPEESIKDYFNLITNVCCEVHYELLAKHKVKYIYNNQLKKFICQK